METKENSHEIDVQQYWLALKRRWLWVVLVLMTSVGLSSFAILKREPEYSASGMLLFKSDRISSLTKAGEKIGDLSSLMREGNPLQTEALILNSQPILKEVINRLGLKDKQGNPLETGSLKIQVEPIVGTDVLKVSYSSSKAELAASVVNQVMKSYVEKNIQSNLAQVLTAGEFIKKQLPSSKQQLELATEELRKFKDLHRIIDLSQESTAAIQNIAKLDGEINQEQARLADVNAQLAKAGSQLNLQTSQAVEITSLSQIPGVQELLSSLQKVQTKLATEKARYSSEHPSIADLKNQEENLNALLQQRIEQTLGTKQKIPLGYLQIGKIKQDLTTEYVKLETQREGLQQKIQALSDLRATYQNKLAVVPSLEKKQRDLEQKLSVAQTNYQNLVTRLQEIQLAEKQSIGNASVIQPAQVPKQAVLSKTTLLLAGGSVFVGLLLGVAAAFCADLIDRSLQTVKEVEKFFDYPTLGLIPKFESNSAFASTNLMGDSVSERVLVASPHHSLIHQAYQMLNANLKFISHKKLCTIVVTSSVADEGKSEVAANLAATMALSGRRVLLVDGNMRQPVQHHLWGLINSVGFSNVIVGEDEFSLAVQKVTKNLSILTAGVQPPNPVALIDSVAMISLIEMLSENYDCIVFDTPALAETADAAILGKMADGVLLVVRPGVVSLDGATVAKSLLERSEANILGIIANAIDVKQKPYRHYYSKSRSLKGITETEMRNEEWAYKSN